MNEYTNLVLGALSIAVGVLSLMSTWLLFVVKTWQASIEQLRREDNELRQEIGAINILVAGQYVTGARFDAGMKDQREQFRQNLAEQTAILMVAIQRIDEKLDGKADR
jgi:flagellar biosynthesis regulator FlaF